jgi:glutamate dehydrogenase/leucine dehydrogenase
MANFCSNMLGVSAADRGELNTSDCAAMGVYYSIKATVQALDMAGLQGVTVAIKGVGKLGAKLAQLLSKDGADLVVADINPGQTEALKRLLPSIKVVDSAVIHKQQTTIYAPCALGNEVNQSTLGEFNCKAIVGGANNQLADESFGQRLHERGILFAPDYIANSGGLIYVADELEPGGFSKERVLDRIKTIEKTLADVYAQAKTQNSPTCEIADTIAEERLSR